LLGSLLRSFENEQLPIFLPILDLRSSLKSNNIMKLTKSFVSTIYVLSATVLPTIMANPIPSHRLSFIEEAAHIFAAKAEKEFGSGKHPPYLAFVLVLLSFFRHLRLQNLTST
jgi:hypothetical protein